MAIRMLLVGLTMLPLAVGAGEFDYTYVEGVYVTSKTDAGPIDIDGDGFGVRGSFGVASAVHVFGGYLSQDMDFGLESESYDIGVGTHWDLMPNLHLVGELSWVNVKVRAPSGASAKDDGLGAGAGLRFRPMGSLELHGMIQYVDVGDSDTSLSLGARYYFTDVVSIGGGLAVGDDVTAWNVGVRAQFGGNGQSRRR